MNKAQWVLLTTLAASFYGVGNIWMTQLGWRLWPYVSPGEFAAYHNACQARFQQSRIFGKFAREVAFSITPLMRWSAA